MADTAFILTEPLPYLGTLPSLNLALLLWCKLEAHLGPGLWANRYLLGLLAQKLMPYLDLVLAWGHVLQFEITVRVSDHIVRAIRGHQPGGHPLVSVAGDFYDFGLGKLLGHHLFCLGLCLVDRGIGQAIGMNVVKDAVAVQDIHRAIRSQ